VKLLFDQNLSHRLVSLLSDLYPGSDHVRHLGMTRCDDINLWEYAKAEGFVLVTKDEDYHARSMLYGSPPKVLWIRSGNCSTDLVETLLRKNYSEIENFVTQLEAGFLVLQ
jgi:predicted nuclease of predicted toxin-antitoxin system